MPSSSYETTKIVLSGPKNFQLWMLRLPGALAKEKVLGVVTGTDLAPTTTTPTTSPPPQGTTTGQSTQDDWQTRDYKARGIIMDWIDDRLALHLESEGLAPLAPTATSKKMYNKLVEIHCEVNVGINAFYNFVELVGL
ncbi:hypothetical protein K439DRAFT_1620678 [Ramaria rubella]|nr:hypothetical protein K439DRAFT_1620678 [Ramaria rubella]